MVLDVVIFKVVLGGGDVEVVGLRLDECEG